MKTIRININETTKAGKTFLAMIDTFLKGKKGVEIIEEEKSKEEIIEELSNSAKRNITKKYLKEYL
ncbi:hypothetical protein [Polaribacter sp. Hel_I_88]|uniref:hypothetical protein n=1 Tax=Polaribacter sp. Hel_I_88 TaxID=1250006 RepID=UPI00047E7C90|nr:hypothetical protein [Polaribacter sp. Hel_I_88]